MWAEYGILGQSKSLDFTQCEDYFVPKLEKRSKMRQIIENEKAESLDFTQCERQLPVTKIIEEVCGEICDNYCKYPYQESEDGLCEKCNECPLNRLY